MTTTEIPALDRWGEFDRDNPFPLFAHVQAAGPVHAIRLADGHRAFLVVGYEEARVALHHPDLSKDMHRALEQEGAVVAEGLPGRDFARHMLSVDPPDHTRLRSLAAGAFTRTRLAALEPAIHRAVGALLGALTPDADGVVDLVAGFAAPLPFTVIGDLLGLPETEQVRLAGWFATLLAPHPGSEPPPAAVAASDNIVQALHDLVDRRWDSPPAEDLLGDLVRACREQQLTRQELLSTVFQLIVAGHHTTTSLIGNGVVALLTHPEQRDVLLADLTLVPRAVEEFMRWDAPVPHSTFRYAVRDVSVGDVVIPAGTQVIVSLAAAGRDPARYPNPDTLDVTRTDNGHLAFGHGVHHCLGARLARLEGVIAFTALLHRFPSMQLAVPRSELRWDHGDGLVLRGLTGLPVRLNERTGT